MSYLGRKGAEAPLTTADIPDNSITGAKIVAGTIEASDVAADMATQAELDLKANLASPTFTGTIGGGTLGSAVVFPAGHILQVVNSHIDTGSYIAHTNAWASTGLAATITLKQANAKVLISYSQSVEFYGTDETGISIKCFGNLASAGDVAIEETQVDKNVRWSYSSINYIDQAVCTGHVETLSNSAGQAWVVTVKGYEHSGSTYTHLVHDSLGDSRASHLTLMEVAV